MTEAILKSGLVKSLKRLNPDAVILRHEDKITHGIPDLTFTLKGTSWWEGKYANPSFKSKGIQALTMKRLAKQGRAFYVIWDEPQKSTFIVHPDFLDSYQADCIGMVIGFGEDAVAKELKKIHDYYRS